MLRALVAVLCLTASAASAQESPCGPTGQVEARISKEYGESLIGAGIVQGGVLFTTLNPPKRNVYRDAAP